MSEYIISWCDMTPALLSLIRLLLLAGVGVIPHIISVLTGIIFVGHPGSGQASTTHTHPDELT